MVSTVGRLKDFTQTIVVNVVNELQSHYFLNDFRQEGEVRDRPKVRKFLIIKTLLFQQRTNYSLFKFSGHDRGLQRQLNNFPDHRAKEIKATKKYSRGDRVVYKTLMPRGAQSEVRTNMKDSSNDGV